MKSTNELKHSISRGYDLEITPPALPCTPLADCDVFYDPELTAWLKVRGLDIASKFSFLNLGLLAYLGGKSKRLMKQCHLPVLNQLWLRSVNYLSNIRWRGIVASSIRRLSTFRIQRECGICSVEVSVSCEASCYQEQSPRYLRLDKELTVWEGHDTILKRKLMFRLGLGLEI